MKFRNIIKIVATVSLVSFLAHCSKEKKTVEECETCNTQAKTPTTITFEGSSLNGYVSTYSDPSRTWTTFFKTENSSIMTMLSSLRGDWSIPTEFGATHIAMVLIYDSTYIDSLNQIPVGIITYDKIGGRVVATYYDEVSGNYYPDSDLTGFSAGISKLDAFDISDVKSLDGCEFFALVDGSLLPVGHKSVFQFQIEYYIEPIGPTERRCDNVPECSPWPDPGMCYFQEHTLGAETANCAAACPFRTVNNILDDNTISWPSSELDAAYELRDILMSSENGRTYLDDYYYAGKIVDADLVLSNATDLLSLYNMGFFEKLSHFNDSTYNDSIFINNSEYTVLSDIVDDAFGISTDTRFQSIVTRIDGDISAYKNKTFEHVKNDF